MADSDSPLSDLSELSSAPPTDDEMEEVVAPVKVTKAAPQKKKSNGSILSYLKKAPPPPPSPPRKKRPASPPHEMASEDNSDIAFIVMFRSRFTEAFPPKCPHLGPQDVERGVSDPLPSSQIESLLCALLGLVVNRKKPVEKGHYGRALEEAIHAHKSSWPKEWGGINPINGGRSFNTMSATERLTLLKTLILWSLHSSEVVSAMIKDSYKSRTSKEKNDINIPLSVQPWGEDGDKRKYWLIEGQDDTAFRVYRESDLTSKKHPGKDNTNWWSVAGSIEDLRVLAQKLADEDGTRKGKTLSERMINAIPRFEATEEKRKRREYRQTRKAAFTRPDPGFFPYETRTRGKRMKYTFSDEEDDDGSDDQSVRRSGRRSGRETPAVASGPTVTASGRQVRSRATGVYGESLLSGQAAEGESPATGGSDASGEQAQTNGRSTRGGNKSSNGWGRGRKHIETYNSLDEMDEEDDASSSGGEWDGGDDDEKADQMDLDDDDEDDSVSDDDDAEPKSLVVRLRYPKGAFNHTAPTPTVQEQSASAVAEEPSDMASRPPSNFASGAHSSLPPGPQLSKPTQPPTPPQIHATSTVPDGYPVQHESTIAPPVAVTQEAPRPAELPVQPKPWPVYAATPPYSAPEDSVPKPQVSLPTPTPATSWQ